MLKKLSVFIFGERLQSHLSERVRESIAQQQCESEKLISWMHLLLVVTFVLAVAIVRAQRVLNRAVLETTAAEDLSRFVSAEIADRITSADRAIQPGDGEPR